jgi:hypothetical protein
MEYSGAREKLNNKKNVKLKISGHTPFNKTGRQDGKREIGIKNAGCKDDDVSFEWSRNGGGGGGGGVERMKIYSRRRRNGYVVIKLNILLSPYL